MGFLKILGRHAPSYNSLLTYILKEGKNEKPQIFTHNLHSKDPQLAVKEFIQNESFSKINRSNKIYFTHEIFSMSPKSADKITPEILADIGKRYIELRANKALVYGAVHQQENRNPHFHFLISSSQLYTGEAMRMSHAELKELKLSIQDYYINKYPELAQSACQHGKGKQYQNNKEFYQTKRNAMKTEIKKTIEECLEKANSQKEFIELLRENDLHHYERKAGEISGILFEDTKFRLSGLIDTEKLKALPIDITEEQLILKEIEEIREQRQDKTLHRILEFEENGIPKTISYNMEMKTESWRDANGESHDIESELTTDEFLEFERRNAIMNEDPDRFDKETELETSSELDEFVEHLNSNDDMEMDADEPDLDSDDKDKDDVEPDRENDNDLDMDSDDDLGR